MGTTTAVNGTNFAAMIAATANGQSDQSMSSDAFAALVQSFAAGLQSNLNPLDAIAEQISQPPPNPQPLDLGNDNNSNDNDDTTTASTQSQDSNKSNTQTQNTTNNGTSSTNSAAQTADTQNQIDPTQIAQLVAVQAQLLTSATATPQAQTATPDTAVTVPTADAAAVDPNSQATAAPTTSGHGNPFAQLLAAPNASTQAAQTTQGPALPTQQAATPQTTPTATPTPTPTTTTAATANAANAAQAQAQSQDQTAVLPQANQTTAADTQTPGAKAQSDALTKLLGANNQIQVNVSVTGQAAATPSINPYNHFVGYTMAANAAESLANGGAGSAQTDTDVLDQLTPADVTAPTQTTNILALSAAAAATPVITLPTTSSAAPAMAAAQAETAAVTGVSEAQSSDAAQNNAGQAGLGQSQTGANGANSTNQTNASNAAQSTKSPATSAQIFDQVKVQITRAAKAGQDQVSIQLRPDDLGRVDIKLQMNSDGTVHAHVIADKPETLQLMQNDSRGLEKALNDAGLHTNSNSLDFSLRGDGSSQSGNGTAQSGGDGTSSDTQTADDSIDPTYDYSQAASQRGGIDTYV